MGTPESVVSWAEMWSRYSVCSWRLKWGSLVRLSREAVESDATTRGSVRMELNCWTQLVLENKNWSRKKTSQETFYCD